MTIRSFYVCYKFYIVQLLYYEVTHKADDQNPNEVNICKKISH